MHRDYGDNCGDIASTMVTCKGGVVAMRLENLYLCLYHTLYAYTMSPTPNTCQDD